MDTKPLVDTSKYVNPLGAKNKFARLIWTATWRVLALIFPRNTGASLRKTILRGFGAKIASTATIYSTARIYQPWKLVMKEHSCLGPDVDCYNHDWVIIGCYSTISQKAFLCTSSHDINDKLIPLIFAPISIEDQVWVGASAFIGMGVTIKTGSVIGATASVYKTTNPWTVYGGNPAKALRKRVIEE